MKWLFVAVTIALTAAINTSAQNPTSGTCASINYSNTCCPPNGNCQASDGNCHCSADCHSYGDCCADVHCPAEPRTCMDVGITTCCHDETGSGHCDVHFGDSRCSCNVSCHLRDDCCPDATNIGCIPQTCTEAGKDPGCCIWSNYHYCDVQANGEVCYCDSICAIFDDCCDDVTSSATSQCDNALMSRTRIQAHLEQALKGSTTQRHYNERQHRTRTQNANTNSAYFRAALSARVQRPRPRARAREYKSERPAPQPRPIG